MKLCLKHNKPLTADGVTCLECGIENYERRKAIELKTTDLRKTTKKLQSGLRKCKGHKPNKFAKYSLEGQCSVCGGYLK